MADVDTEVTKVTRSQTHEFGPVKRRKFLQAFRQSANIRASCDYAGISRTTYYRTIAEDEEFAAQVQVAEQEAIDRLEAKAWNNAIQKDSEQSLWNLLKAHRPKKYRDPVQRFAQTNQEGEDVTSAYTDDQLLNKAATIIAGREKDAP